MRKNISLTQYNMFLLIIFCNILIHMNSQAVAPVPYCHSKPIYTTLPMIIGETIIGDLSYAINGYNLDIIVRGNQTVATIPPKLKLYDNLVYNFSGLKNHRLQKKGNNWGEKFHLLTYSNNTSILYIGTFKNKESVPSIDLTIIVSQKDNIYCYDAVTFFDQGIAIVDCSQKNINQKNIVEYRNIFIYVDIGKGKVIKQVQNQLYVPYTQINKRQILRYHDPITGYEYIIRCNFANGVDRDHAQNTYLQLFSAIDIDDLQILNVFDRTTIGFSQLSIVDFKIYLGDIFILDYFRGLYRINILSHQALQIINHFEAQNFIRFAVYSNDLDQQLSIILANNHAIHQMSWNMLSTAILVTKYTLMQNSHVHNIILDHKYVVVQSSANTTQDNYNYFMINYTWIFTKGSRTYRNAYKVINHNSSDVLIDLNLQEQKLLVIDQTGIRNYQLNQAIVTIQQKDQAALDTYYDLVIQAISTDPNSIAVQVCTQRTRIYFVRPDNMSIWPSGIPISDTYYSNYPGRIEILLNYYAIGSNITFNVQKVSDNELPTHWIFQKNITYLRFPEPIVKGDINFFYTEVVPRYGNDTVIYYYQDIRNVTFVANCLHIWEDIYLDCKIQAQYAHNSRIGKFSTAMFFTEKKFCYYYLYTFETNPSVLYVIDFINHKIISTIEFQKGFQGTIGSIATSNGILFLTLPYIKTINAYKLSDCVNGACKLSFSLDAKSLKPLGIDYFAPVQLVTTRHHPEVLFIKSRGSVIILDVDNKQNIILLQQIFSQAIVNTAYRLAVNQYYLVVVASPNKIEEYYLGEIYSKKKVTYFKSLYLYDYIIQPDFDLQFSDFGDLFYINAIDKTNLTTVLVYRTGVNSVGSLYDVINLPGNFKHQNLQIEISGYYLDYVSIIASGEFYLYRIYEFPFLVIEDSMNDFSFQLNYYNKQTSKNLSKIQVKIANYPQNFTLTQQFQKFKQNLKITQQGSYTWDTRKWFKGHVLRYNSSCEECGDKVNLINHIHDVGKLPVGANDYAQTLLGGISLWEDLFRFSYNGSIQSVILLPDQKQGEKCVKVASRNDDLITTSACQILGGGVNIYISSQVSQKAFTYGPFKTSARYAKNLQIVNNLLAITDVDYYPQYRFRAGGVYLYALNLDPISQNEMDQIDYIDSNDFLGAHGWDQDDVYIGNSHLMYDGFDKSYRLYVTELFHGIFIVDFKYQLGNREINILTTNFVNLNQLLINNNLHMPSDAFFLAVTHISYEYNPHFEVEKILLTTSGFHNFQITLVYDQGGNILSYILHRVYYRYAYYNSINYVKASQNYVAIGYVIPPLISFQTNYSKQLIVLYDSKDYPNDSPLGYSERYMLGAHIINHTQPSVFGFNRTYDDKSNGTRIGLVIVDRQSNVLYQTSITRNLSLAIQKDFKNQLLSLTPFNDFGNYTFTLQIIAFTEDTGLGLLPIIFTVLGCILGIGFISYSIFLCWKRKKIQQMQVLQETMIEENTETPSVLMPRVNESLQFSQSNRTTLLNEQQRQAAQQDQQEQEQEQQDTTNIESLVAPPIAIEEINQKLNQKDQQ